MMKDVDACSRHINTLIYHSLVSAYYMRYHDILSCPHTYSYDVFHYCSNPLQR